MSEDYELIQRLANRDVETLKKKGQTYGSSWSKRGGVGSFMMLARKWDRIENIVEKNHNYNIFSAGIINDGEILDDIRDLRAYLLLVEAHITGRSVTPKVECGALQDGAPLVDPYSGRDDK